ncbi:MAG: DUF1565 domain-containing protein [Thermoflexales bacterium]|nr:DUF1565 domain-containing protein [Thermoflexales bacterium]
MTCAVLWLLSARTTPSAYTAYAPPSADLYAQPTDGFAPFTVTLYNTSRFADAYLWDYGDGLTSTTTIATHTHIYKLPGTYTVSLTATSGYSSAVKVMPGYLVAYTRPVPADYYVDAVNGSDELGDGTAAGPWQTISHALGLAHVPGITLHLAEGVYDTALGERFPIQWPRGAKLVGAVRDTTIISGQAGVDVIQIAHDSGGVNAETALDNLAVQGGEIGVLVEALGSTTPGPVLSNLRVRNNARGVSIAGVKSNGMFSPVLTHLLVHDNTTAGIMIDYFSLAFGTPLISHSDIYSNGYAGLYLRSDSSNMLTPQVVDVRTNYNDCGIMIVMNGSISPYLDRVVSEYNNTGIYWLPEPGGYVDTRLYNVLVAHNQVGLGIWDSYDWNPGLHGAIRVVNSTVAANTSKGIEWYNDDLEPQGGLSLTVINSIVWNPGADDLYASPTSWVTSQVQYSDIEDGDFAGQAGNFSSDPLFVNAANGDFHVLPASPVIDAGNSFYPGLPATDLDGRPRIAGAAVDVGALELPIGLAVTKHAEPAPVLAGAQLTYTIRVTNTGALTLTAAVTDTLPAYVTSGTTPGGTWFSPGETITWDRFSVAPGNTWVYSFAVGVATAYSGLLTNTVELVADRGIRGVYSTSSQVWNAPAYRLYLPLVLRHS